MTQPRNRPTREDFEALAGKGYNRIPVTREVLADLETPLSTYLKLAGGPHSYLFESVYGGEKWGRYSIIGLPCSHRLIVRGFEVIEETDEGEITRNHVEDPLAWIGAEHQRYHMPELPGLPRFVGGLVGHFGYDTVRYIESRLVGGFNKPDPLDCPDILLMFSEEVVVFDNLLGRLHAVILADPEAPGAYDQASARLDEILEQLNRPGTGQHLPEPAAQPLPEPVPGFPREAFEEAVERVRQYIHDGDVMQAVLSQRLTVSYEGRPLDLYRALRTLNPSPYMYYLDLGGYQVVGSSPEILTRVEHGEVTVRPIAGTRPRGEDEATDEALEKGLLADPKELAEHLMLVDLGRNDVGRVAQTGSVRLTERMAVERYSHVMHIVSNVTGRLRPDLTPVDALRATFPAGTVSGAPKIRAMEIIDELEPVKRGVYAGAVGYLGWSGNMDTAIAIRTAVVKDGAVHVQAGAGIVADSVPEREWEETMNKGRALFRAVEMAAGGLSTLDRYR